MKKTITALLTIAMLTALLAGCGNEKEVDTPSTNEVVEVTTPNTSENESTSVEVPETSEPVVDEPIVEITPPAPVGVVMNHSNGWYRCEPLDNGMYKYEMYSMDLDKTYTFEIPISPEELQFKYAWNETKSDYDFEFKRKGFIFWIHTTNADTVTTENYDDFSIDKLTIETNYFEHYVDGETFDTYIWSKKFEDGTNKIGMWLNEYDYIAKCKTEVGLTVTDPDYSLEDCVAFLKTWQTIENDKASKIQNQFFVIDEIVTNEFNLNDVSTLTANSEIQMSVIGSFDKIKPYIDDTQTYQELTVSLNMNDFSTIPSDTLKSLFETLFAGNELYAYGTEDKLSEFPTTFTAESTPYFYYNVNDTTYGVVSIDDNGVLKINIKYYEK